MTSARAPGPALNAGDINYDGTEEVGANRTRIGLRHVHVRLARNVLPQRFPLPLAVQTYAR